jgi:hypothetical protein
VREGGGRAKKGDFKEVQGPSGTKEGAQGGKEGAQRVKGQKEGAQGARKKKEGAQRVKGKNEGAQRGSLEGALEGGVEALPPPITQTSVPDTFPETKNRGKGEGGGGASDIREIDVLRKEAEEVMTAMERMREALSLDGATLCSLDHLAYR